MAAVMVSYIFITTIRRYGVTFLLLILFEARFQMAYFWYTIIRGLFENNRYFWIIPTDNFINQNNVELSLFGGFNSRFLCAKR